MNRREKIALGIAIAVVLAATAIAAIRTWSIGTMTGAVLRQDASPENQLPIPNADIRVNSNLAAGKSDSNGYFRISLHRSIRKGEMLTVHMSHPDYHPLDIEVVAGDRLYVMRMTPASSSQLAAGTVLPISEVRLRYGVKNRTTVNVGSVVKVFEVPNTGDVPCGANGPCSPDGKWKAAFGSASLDAGDDSEFQDARVSCISGPCPFTRIEKDSFSHGGRRISVVVRNWSDTVSFVVEAEVMHTMSSDVILHSYPVIFNQTATFTLPPKAQGPSIEATVDHQNIVYPLGPAHNLSWAECDVQTSKDLTKVYRCVLKPGYQFERSGS